MKKTNLYFLSIALFLSSCAFHDGIMTGNAAISQPDFSIIDFATGSSSTTHIIGIGGLEKKSLVNEAKRNLYLNHPLKKGQALANVVVDFKRSFYLIVSKTTVTISADIVDFNRTPGVSTENLIDIEKKDEKHHSLENFNLGETVVFYLLGNKNEGQIIGFDKTQLVIEYVGKNAKQKTARLKADSAYKTELTDKNIEQYGHQIGDKVKVKIFNKKEERVTVEGTIIGMNDSSAILRYIEGEGIDYVITSLKKLKEK